MGKKVNILASDPILSKNFKYEKRNKNKMIEKMKTEEERALQLKKKKEILEVENKVDRQIEQISANLALTQKDNCMARMKKQLFHNSTRKEEKVQKISMKTQQIILSAEPQNESCYSHHYGLIVKNEDLVKQSKKSRTQQIEQQTRQEIKSMFSLGKDQVQAEELMDDQNRVQSNQIYLLSPSAKRETQICIDNQLFQASSNLKNNKHLLKQSSLQDKTMAVAESLINGYFDHVYIENQHEEKIEQFRKIVIKHATTHFEECLKDQKGRGFTNCKLLILTPFLGDARAIADLIEEQFTGFAVSNRQKFEQIQDENDFFRVGIKIARKKKTVTYFSHFDHSEIIIASPVGLKSIIGSQGDEKRQISFISSVQLLYIDRASVLLMQNWSHVTEILKNLNYMPKYQSLKNSIDTIRDSFVELKGRIYRQSIVFSQYNFPQLNALKLTHFHNLQGIATTKAFYKKPTIKTSIEQNFYKIQVKQPKDDLQIRFQYFKRKFWDDLQNKETMSKVVLFTNSYFEYVKLKSFLEKVNASAQYICEHTSTNKVQSRLAKFNNEKFRILLITERAYYFDICQVKKFHHIYFYSLPRNSFIYEDLIENMQPHEGGSNNNIVSIYTKFDILILQRIVGTVKALEMVREYCNNVSFIL